MQTRKRSYRRSIRRYHAGGKCETAPKRKRDLTNCKFHHLTALHETEKRTKHLSVIWACKCDCGALVEVPRSYLVAGAVKSCGCKRKKREVNIVQRLHFVDGTCVEFLEKRSRRTDNKTGHIGVSVHGNRYRVNITFQGKRHYLGTYERLDEAIAIREQAERELYKPFLQRFHKNEH